ncbi:MAG: hypothetical protein R3E57_07720 [Porticoccaceae bacterium]
MDNVHDLGNHRRPPDDVDNAGIQALYLAGELTPGQQRALARVGFEEYDNNVLAIKPRGMTREECQSILDATKRPLIPVDTGELNSLEEALAWLGE